MITILGDTVKIFFAGKETRPEETMCIKMLIPEKIDEETGEVKEWKTLDASNGAYASCIMIWPLHHEGAISASLSTEFGIFLNAGAARKMSKALLLLAKHQEKENKKRR